MGKLVWFLADGTTLGIPLDRARVTVGRRPGNDVCLPYPAVSAEHAAFVPLSTGAVVEDLASTNGTFVNGDRATRQILHDGDRIDIGRQRFVYLTDVNAVVSGPPRGPGCAEQALDEAPALPATLPSVDTVPEWPRVHPPETRAGPDLRASGAVVGAVDGAILSWADTHAGAGMIPMGHGEAVAASGGPIGAVPAGPLVSVDISDAPANARQCVASIKVVTGPNAGRILPLVKDESLIGRVGIQVAAVRRAGNAFRVVPIEGAEPPCVNGVPVPPDGSILQTGDTAQVAGVELEFLVREAPAPD